MKEGLPKISNDNAPKEKVPSVEKPFTRIDGGLVDDWKAFDVKDYKDLIEWADQKSKSRTQEPRLDDMESSYAFEMEHEKIKDSEHPEGDDIKDRP